MRIVVGVFFGAALVVLATVAVADDSEVEFFEKKIRPALVTYCYECHSADSKKLGGELLLDSRDGVRKGGETGPAIRTGQPDESLRSKPCVTRMTTSRCRQKAGYPIL